MTKLCFGVFEKRGWPNTAQHPLFWVNAHIFDYRGILLSRDTLHLWKYSLGDIMPTHESNLSPLRHTVSNPDRDDTPNLIMQFFSLDLPTCDENGTQILQSTSSLSEGATEKLGLKPPRIEFNEIAVSSCADGSLEDSHTLSLIPMSKGSMDKSKFDNVISKYYDQELKMIANRDPLHDITVQVSSD
jgi:hypothetical protein